MTCPNCGRDNRGDAQFCDACGIRIRPTASASGERRQLTALFCDIVGFTRLSGLLDGEDLHRLVRAYQKTVSDVIARWGGHIESYVGDGVNAYFGYPQAHENDAERAVRAGLDIIAELDGLNLGKILDAKGTAPTLAVRVGVHTGPVVVGELGGGEYGKKQALGPAMNVAARLQAIARPGSVVMSEATDRLVSGMFLSEDVGAPPLKGIDEPIRAYVVLQSTGVRDRLDAYPHHAAPLVGRERELGEMRGHWQQARRGQGQILLISGEAGIGKSRLVRRFAEWVAEEGAGRTFEWRCSPFLTTTPLHPVVDSLQQQLGLDRGAAPRAQIYRRIETLLASGPMAGEEGFDPGAAAQLIGDTMYPGQPDKESAVQETPAVRRSRTLHLLCDLARAQARQQPSVIVVEDVHWADPSTIELLGLLVKSCGDVPLALVLTFRADFAQVWAGENVHLVSLQPLTMKQCAELFDTLVGPRQVPSALRDELLARADGVPLFVEELTRAVLDPIHDRSVDVPAAVPSTLRGLLVSRLDRLSPGALETIHLASALSREFRFNLLESVSIKTTRALRDDLDALVRSGLISLGPAPDGDTYIFKHALVADAAYDSILRSDRRRLHRQIAHRMREVLPAVAVEQPELLAHHFAEAGEPETAIDYWRNAGDSAIARGAYQEAVRRFDRGLELLSQVANDRVRLQCEIELTESKGTALFSTLGYAHPDVERTFAHASTLCDRYGSSPPLRVLYGLWAVHITRSNRANVEALLPRFVDLARTTGDPVARLSAHANLGVCAFLAGHFEKCLAEMTEAARWYSTSEHSEFLRRHGYGGGLYPLAYRMWALSILGRSDQAASAGEELHTLAEQAANPYGLAISLGFRINLARERRDPVETQALSERQIEYSQRQMLPMWEALARCSRGWARAQLGMGGGGIEEIIQGLQVLDAVGLRMTYAYYLGALAEAQLATGDFAGALATASRGLAVCQSGFNCFHEAELLRLSGEAQWHLGNLGGAESSLASALDVARRQSAALFSVRAGASLARLLAVQGRGELARETLESILTAVSGSPETHDTADARELLRTMN